MLFFFFSCVFICWISITHRVRILLLVVCIWIWWENEKNVWIYITHTYYFAGQKFGAFFFVSLFCVAGWLVISGIKPSAANIYVREKKNACATTIADRAVLCVNLYVCAPQQTYTHICTYTTNKEQNIYTEIHKIIATAETANALSAGVNVFILIYLSLEIHIQLHWMVFILSQSLQQNVVNEHWGGDWKRNGLWIRYKL